MEERHHHPSDPVGWRGKQRSRPPHQSARSDGRVSVPVKAAPCPKLERNTLEIMLSFIDRADWKGEAVLDSGADGNWMNEELSKSLGLRPTERHEECYLGFQGSPLKSSLTVEGFWLYDHRTYDVAFRLVENAPFDVLLGYDQLRAVGLVDFEAGVQNHMKPVLVLAKDKSKESKDQRQASSAHATRERSRMDNADLYDRLCAEGWRWDDEKKQMWRKDENGNIQWTEKNWT
ncbi:uncharacterized protein Z518_06881 [Rhinocladiella mackenziei CBS 650.93]|uniref:Uncharacterized protein n=1 Tax=Rhinocladiella mackenziei CBS 650.93 TaxID=1442369 RepID=A0A0D2IBY9_9EURO|nr:uncharacterized protein Z518_06881 [Rhinocladiella mackenziei CBS 650.93]KIX03329.1 hypothetical protein Z518_06881 [Rhinocladiella mackenziei CBS 650.93]